MFGINRNLEALANRMLATLELADDVMRQAQVVLRNVDGLVTDVRDLLDAMRRPTLPDRRQP
jgi:hypothetical protein